ncbi:hypothetical protein LINPERHAP1_LOCUS26614, partial [Linum perenne]
QPKNPTIFPLNSSHASSTSTKLSHRPPSTRPPRPQSHALLGRAVARPPQPSSHALLGRRRTPSSAALHTPRRPPLNVSSIALGSSVAAARLHDCHP